MKATFTRRNFLAGVGQGALATTLGSSLANELGLFPRVLADEAPGPLRFGELEPLVQLMQDMPVTGLQQALTNRLKAGMELKRLVSAGALANARTFGGEDYTGFHTLMALAPAFYMSESMPVNERALPVFKVLYRNTQRIQERGGRPAEVLHAVHPADHSAGAATPEQLREAVRRKDVGRAERQFASLAQSGPQAAFEALLLSVQDHTEVHRTVLPYRAWDLLGLIGQEHAQTLLRQSVRYCVNAENWRHPDWDRHGKLLLRLLEEHQLLSREPGRRTMEDRFMEELSQAIFRGTPEQAATAAAQALAEGFNPDDVGGAISLATNQLVLRDHGRPPAMEVAGKPVGSVHGDSIGVHASDSANAWRNMARVSAPRNMFSCLILGAWQAALDRAARGGDFLTWEPLPLQRHLRESKAGEPEKLLRELDEAIRGNLQARAAAVTHRCGELGHPDEPVFGLLLRYAVSEDGALHAEKYFRTCWEEFHATRPAFRWRHLVALARVTASEFGRPAAGQQEARELLNLKPAA